MRISPKTSSFRKPPTARIFKDATCCVTRGTERMLARQPSSIVKCCPSGMTMKPDLSRHSQAGISTTFAAKWTPTERGEGERRKRREKEPQKAQEAQKESASLCLLCLLWFLLSLFPFASDSSP